MNGMPEHVIEQTGSPLPSGARIRDDDLNEEIMITDEMITRSQHAKQKIQQSLFAIAEGLAEIRDYRLYLVDHCHSFRAWIERYASMSRRNAYHYLTIIDKYANRHGVVQLVSQQFENVGMRKLLELAKLPKEQFERFKRTGEMIAHDGQVFDLQAIQQMPVHLLHEHIQQIRGKDTPSSTRAMSRERTEHHAAIKGILHSITKQLAYVADDELQQYEQELHALEQRIAQRIGGETRE